MRKVVLLFASALTALVLSSGVTMAQIIIGTDNNETLTGTNSADHITGKGGNDTLKGKAGNDIYHFNDGFGVDTVTETATVKVGTKKLPGGTDTLSFSQYDSSTLDIRMIPQWGADWNRVFEENGEQAIKLGSSRVENVVGGSVSDFITGGADKNTYNGGPGGIDVFRDWGGIDATTFGTITEPALAASDDTYKAHGAGFARIEDYGGSADRLDLRPLDSSEVYFDREGSALRITISDTPVSGTVPHSVLVIGHFAPDPNLTGQENGRMEQIIFSNETITSGAAT